MPNIIFITGIIALTMGYAATYWLIGRSQKYKWPFNTNSNEEVEQ